MWYHSQAASASGNQQAALTVQSNMHTTVRSRPSKAQQKEQQKQCHLWQCLLAEFVGTLFLTTVATAAVVVGQQSSEITHADKVVAPGLLVMAMIYTVGNLSGAHFNPAVTLAFAARRDFPWTRVPAYWLVQFIGAVVGCGVTALLFGTGDHIGATLPHAGAFPALGTELLLTTILLLVILGSSKNHKITGSNAAIAVGATISLCGMIASPISGASMNPARSFGPALLSGSLDTMWIYIIGPCCGALLAVLLLSWLHGPHNDDEVEAAQGED